MLANLRTHLRLGWKQAASSAVSRLALLSASEQTRLTWARRIDTYANVPAAFESFFEPLLAAGREFPYTVLTPSSEGFLFQTTEKLVCDLGSELAVLEKSGNGYEIQCYPLDRISYLEVRSVLLDSRLKISGVSGQGTPASTTLRYNAVTDFMFAPILKKVRLAGAVPGEGLPGAQAERFDDWTQINFKLRNFARQSLLSGEDVLQSILQPEIRKSRITVLGKTFYKTIAPALACILTGRELILIRDDLRQIQIGSTRYGGIWQYIPLAKIVSLSLAERNPGLLALSVELPAGAWLECLFQASRQADLDRLVDHFQEIATGHPVVRSTYFP